MPKLRRRRVCWRDSWVDVHEERRDSRGCVEESCGCCDEVEGEVREERRVSWRPGAEGAPRSRF